MSEKNSHTLKSLTINILLFIMIFVLLAILYQVNILYQLTQHKAQETIEDTRTYDLNTDVKSIDFTRLDKKYFVEKICIDGYVYVNMYQKMPVMTIKLGTSTAYPNYLVLKSTTQSFIDSKDFLTSPEKCIN